MITLESSAPPQGKRHGQYEPQIALILGQSASGSGPTMISRHTIAGGEIQAGALIDHETVVALLERLQGVDAEQPIRPIHPRLVAASRGVCIWHCPAAVRPMTFRIEKRVHVLSVPWPALLLKASHRSLSCVALRDKADPKNFNAPVFHAPLMNVYQTTAVCLPQGTSLVVRQDEAGLKSAEAAMFDTAFSHTNGAVGLNPQYSESSSTGAMFSFWKSLEGKQRFPAKALNPTHLSVSQWANNERHPA